MEAGVKNSMISRLRLEIPGGNPFPKWKRWIWHKLKGKETVQFSSNSDGWFFVWGERRGGWLFLRVHITQKRGFPSLFMFNLCHIWVTQQRNVTSIFSFASFLTSKTSNNAQECRGLTINGKTSKYCSIIVFVSQSKTWKWLLPTWKISPSTKQFQTDVFSKTFNAFFPSKESS